MPNIWHHTTPLNVLLAPARESKDLLDFNRDPTKRPCCISPRGRPTRGRRALPPLSEQVESPRCSPVLDAPIAKRPQARKPLKASCRGQRQLLEHSTMCLYEYGSSVGAGGLPSRGPIGNIPRAIAVELAEQKVAEMQEKQRMLRDKARVAPPIPAFVGCADPVRARINHGTSASLPPPLPSNGLAERQTQSAPRGQPPTRAMIYSPIGFRRVRCSSAEISRFEVDLSRKGLTTRPVSSPPRRLTSLSYPSFNSRPNA